MPPSHFPLAVTRSFLFLLRMVIAYHIILTGYGHWLPNDPRGSMSHELRDVDLSTLGEMHFERKARQPTREQLRTFYKLAEQQLRYPVLWFDAPDRLAIGRAVGEVIEAQGLTCYACAVLRNHVHVLLRRHRLKYEQMLHRLQGCSADAIRLRKGTARTHPIWSARSCAVFKDTVQAMRTCVTYINDNPVKHNLPVQRWDFVTPYDDWPFHKNTQ